MQLVSITGLLSPPHNGYFSLTTEERGVKVYPISSVLFEGEHVRFMFEVNSNATAASRVAGWL